VSKAELGCSENSRRAAKAKQEERHGAVGELDHTIKLLTDPMKRNGSSKKPASDALAVCNRKKQRGVTSSARQPTGEVSHSRIEEIHAKLPNNPPRHARHSSVPQELQDII